MVAGLEVGEHPGAGLEQPSRVHSSIMPRAPQASPTVAWSPPYSRGMGTALLEVTVLGPRDVAGADEGGADRLHLVGEGGLSPEPTVVSATCRETELPVFVVLRLNDSWTTTGGELTRLVGLAEDYLGCGATGVVFGFLDADLEVDTDRLRAPRGLAAGGAVDLPRAVDDTLDPRRSWRRLLALPGLVAVALGRVAARAVGRVRRPARHRRVRPADRLAADARRRAARPSTSRGSCRPGSASSTSGPRRGRGRRTSSYVDAGHVRSWRLLLDSAVERSAGSVAG